MSRSVVSTTELAVTAPKASPAATKGRALQETFGEGAKNYRGLAALFLMAGILFAPLTGFAQTASPSHSGSCRVAVLNGQHVQPSAQCHLPPPLAQNPASLENTPPAVVDEVDRIAKYLLGESGQHGDPVSPPIGLRAARKPLAPSC
jgi:hypothetical protein